MEVHQLRYFCAIVEHGTFTRAAAVQHVAQPSLSQQILKLEDELGGKLFYRLPKVAKLTPLGESFLPRAVAILDEIRESKAEARKIVDLTRSQAAQQSWAGSARDTFGGAANNKKTVNGTGPRLQKTA